jgi:hypothetical protein
MKENEKPEITGEAIEEVIKESFYFSESVHDYDFSDFVKVHAYARGMLFTLGKWCPEKGKFGFFREVLVPYEVADSLANIIQKSIKDLTDKGLLQKAEEKSEQ